MVFLPARYCSSCLGFAAIISSMIFSSAEVSRDCCGTAFLFVDCRGNPIALEAEIVKILEHLAGDRAALDQIGRRRHAIHRNRRLLDLRARGLETAHQFALHQVGHALGILRRFAPRTRTDRQATFETVSTCASYSVMPYSFTMRARRASGSSGRVLRDLGLPFLVHHQRQQIGLGKIAVIVRLLFRAHAVGLAFVRVVEACFLRDLAAGFDDVDLARRSRTPAPRG